MKRLFFLNRYFFPDHSATSQILSQLAFYLAVSEFVIELGTPRPVVDRVSKDIGEIVNKPEFRDRHLTAPATRQKLQVKGD